MRREPWKLQEAVLWWRLWAGGSQVQESETSKHLCLCTWGEMANFQKELYTGIWHGEIEHSALIAKNFPSAEPFHDPRHESWDPVLPATFSSITLNVFHYFSVLPLLQTLWWCDNVSLLCPLPPGGPGTLSRLIKINYVNDWLTEWIKTQKDISGTLSMGSKWNLFPGSTEPSGSARRGRAGQGFPSPFKIQKAISQCLFSQDSTPQHEAFAESHTHNLWGS